MLSRKKESNRSFKINPKNIQFSFGKKDNSQFDLENDTRSLTLNAEKSYINSDGNDRTTGSDAYSNKRRSTRPSSAKVVSTDKDFAVPKRIAYLLESGEVSAEIRKRVRPATAQPCSNRLRKTNEVRSAEHGRRPFYSARPDTRYRGGDAPDTPKYTWTRDGDVARRKEMLIKETKQAWTSDRGMAGNRISDDIIEDHIPSNISRRNETLPESQFYGTIRTNLKAEDIITIDTEFDTDRKICEEPRVKAPNRARTGTDTISFSEINVKKAERLKSPYRYADTAEVSMNLSTRNERRKHEVFLGYLRAKYINTDYFDEEIREREHTTGRFQKAAALVQILVRLRLCMTDLSAEMTLRSATEEQWHTLNTSKRVKDLAFNKDMFAKNKAVSWLPRWARVILDKSPDDRTEKDLRHLHALLRGMKSFDSFTEKVQLSMCRSFTYQYVTSGRIILRQGHVGINFYFLYAGSVFVNIDDTDIQGNHFVKTEVILNKGDSFGELALLQDIKRTATVSCREDCEMLVVDKETFAKVCPKIFEKELEEKCDFLQKMNLFSQKFWSREALELLCFDARIMEYKTNRVIVTDSSTDEWIYICMEGKCNVIRKLDLREQLKWIKVRNREKNKRKTRVKPEPDDIDLLGVEEEAEVSESDNSEEDNSEENSEVSDMDSSNLETKKERLLTSMGLEYSQTKRLSIDEITRYLKAQRPKKDEKKEEESQEEEIQDTGPLTLTLLLAKEQREHIFFIHAKTVGEKDVFDLYSILHCDTPTTVQRYILVSQGSRMLRIKKTNFFKDATAKAIDHAKALAELERYPEDEKLVRSYMEHLSWKIYKHSILDHTLSKYKYEHPKKSVYNIAMSENVKQNAKNVDMLNALYQAFYYSNPKMRRLSKWKQMQTMAHCTPKRRNMDQVELTTGIRTLGSLIPEIRVDIHKDYARPRRSVLASGPSGTNSKELIPENPSSATTDIKINIIYASEESAM